METGGSLFCITIPASFKIVRWLGETKSDWKFDRVLLFEPDITDADRLDMHWEFSLGGESVGLWSAYHYL
jgi:hypothetical protein